MADNILVNPDPTQVHTQILTAAFMRILQDDPFFNMFPFGPSTPVDDTGKFNWPDEIRTEKTGTLDLTYTAASGTIQMVSNAGFEDGDIVHIEGHVDATFVEIVLTDTTFALASPPQRVLRQSAKKDNYDPNDDSSFGFNEPVLRSNYMQLFTSQYSAGKKLDATARGGLLQGLENVPSALQLSAELALYNLQFQLYRAIMHGVPQAEVGGANPLGATMGGLNSFINIAATPEVNRVNASGGDISDTQINDLVQLLCERGLTRGENLALILSAKHSRTISALRDSEIRVTEGTNQRMGRQVTVFDSDLIDYGGIRIVVDKNMTDKQAYLLSTNNIQLVNDPSFPLILDENATTPGQWGERHVIYANMSMVVKGATNLHGVIVNLS
jgi:hypothetical protein